MLFILSWYTYTIISKPKAQESIRRGLITGGYVRETAGGNRSWELRRPGNKADQFILDGHSPKVFSSRMPLATAVPLHVCHCPFSPRISMVWMAVGSIPLPLIYCIILWKYPILLGTFTCGLLWRWFLHELYCIKCCSTTHKTGTAKDRKYELVLQLVSYS